MNKDILWIVICVLLGILPIGCAHSPTLEQSITANYGSYPANYKNLIEHYFSKRLFDPYSAVYSEWKGPSKGYISRNLTGTTYFGYRVCVEVNAKNRMGGYAGSKQYMFVLQNGDIIFEEESSGINAQQVSDMCSNISANVTAAPTKKKEKKPDIAKKFKNLGIDPAFTPSE